VRIDVSSAIGRFPFRAHPSGTAESLLGAMKRVGIDRAWVANLTAVYWRDPGGGNEELFQALRAHPSLLPVPALAAGFPGWERGLDRAVVERSVAVRVDPTITGVEPAGADMVRLATAAGERGLPLLMTVRMEDLRQRHPIDSAPTLEPWMIRALIRSAPNARLVVAAADREFVEEVHWGSTAGEAERILWDISWIWGPPEDHLEHLVRTVGADRFCLGTGLPLRLPEASIAKLELTPLSAEARARVESGNVLAWAPHAG